MKIETEEEPTSEENEPDRRDIKCPECGETIVTIEQVDNNTIRIELPEEKV